MAYDIFQGQTVPESVRARILAAQLLQQSASQSQQPFSSRGVTALKALSGLLGGLSEGAAIRQEEAAQAQSRQVLANALAQKYGPLGGSPAAAQVSTPSSASPAVAAPTAAAPQASATSGSGSDVEGYIRQAAAQRGIDPDIAVRVAKSEGLNSYTGDNGSSFGPFQLHYGNVAPGGNAVAGMGDDFTKQTGLDARDPSTVQKQIDFALDNAAKGGWGPWHGAKAANIGDWQGIGQQSADMPAPNANPVMSPMLPPGITPSMIQPAKITMYQGAPEAADPAAPFGAVPTDAGSGRQMGMDPDSARAMAAALLAKGSGLPQMQPVPGPSAPADPANATDYALSPTGLRADKPPAPEIGGLDGGKVSFDPSMLSAPSVDADGNPPFQQVQSLNGFTPPDTPPQNPPLPPPRPDAATLAQVLQQGASQPLPSAPPPSAPSDPSASLPAAAASFAPASFPMSAAPAQQAIGTALQGGTPPSPSPMWAGGMGGNDPSSAQAFNRQQAAGLLNGSIAPPQLSSAAPPSPPSVSSGVMTPLTPSAPVQDAGIFGGLGSILGGAPQQQKLSAGTNPIQAAILDPRIPDSVKMQLFQPAPLEKVDAGQTLIDPRTRQAVFTAPIKPEYSTDATTGLQTNKATGDVRRVAPALGDFEMNRDGLVINKRTGEVQGGTGQTGYRFMTPEEKQAAGLPLDQPLQIGPNGRVQGMSGQTINVGGEQNVYDTAMSKTLAENHVGLMQGIDANRTKLRDLNAMSGALQRLQQNGGTTGLGSEEIKDLQSAVNTGSNALGLGQQFDVSDKEVMAKLARQISGAQAKDIGGARTTNFDMQTMLAANPGLELSPTGNQRMLGIAQQVTQRNIDIGQAMQNAAAAAVQQGRRINPQQMEQIRADYDAQHHITDPITGQDLSASPKLPEFRDKATQPQQQQGAQPARVQNLSDYNALASGTQFIDPQGNIRTKR